MQGKPGIPITGKNRTIACYGTNHDAWKNNGYSLHSAASDLLNNYTPYLLQTKKCHRLSKFSRPTPSTARPSLQN